MQLLQLRVMTMIILNDDGSALSVKKQSEVSIVATDAGRKAWIPQ
jgi:hypothetical protein